MKRGEPPKRRTPMKRTEMKRGDSTLKRTPLARGTKRLRSKPQKRPLLNEREMSKAWHRHACAQAPVVKRRKICPACGKPVTERNPLEAHHVTAQESIKRYVKGLGLDAQEAAETLARLRWDLRNGLAICRACHAAHTSGKRRLPLALVTMKARQFAHEIGLDHLLDRYYRRT
jgi:hypothetical protein